MLPPIDPITTILLPVVTGLLTNRVDARVLAPAVDNFLDRFSQNKPVNDQLQKALRKSFFLALKDIAKECRDQLHGASRVFRWVATNTSDIQWLDRKIKELDKALKQIDRPDEQQPEAAIEFRTEIEALLRWQCQSNERLVSLKDKLLPAAPQDAPNPPEPYKTKVETELIARAHEHFIAIMKRDDEVFKAFFIESQQQNLANLEELPEKVRELLRTDINSEFQKLKQAMLQVISPQDSANAVNPPAVPQQKRPPVIPLNPFVPQNGRVDNPQLFFGREREIRNVFETLNTGSSVALIGKEGIGKSSLLWEICRLAESRLLSSRQPIYLDLNPVWDENGFYSALCEKVGIPDSKGNDLNRHLNSHRVLLAIDNVGKIAREGFTWHIRDWLRGIAEGGDAPLKLIIAAGESLDTLFKDSQEKGKTSPLAGICLEENIKPWDEATIRAFIQSRLDGTSVSFTEEQISRLVLESAGHPRRLVQLCHQTYAGYMEKLQ